MDKELEIEKTHLQNVIIEYQSILADENLRLEVLPKMYKDNELLLMALMDQTRHRIHIMENNLEKPYL